MTASGASDPREDRPCRLCGVGLKYDGWDMVHREGWRSGLGEAECAMQMHDMAHVVLAEVLTSLDALPPHRDATQENAEENADD